MSEEREVEKKEAAQTTPENNSPTDDIKDSDIEAMSVDELIKSAERPRKTEAEKPKEKNEISKSSAKTETKPKKKKGQSAFGRFWKKSKGIIIFLIIVILAVVAFLIYKKKSAEKEALENMVQPEYTLIEKKEAFTDSISTTGTIISPKTSQLVSAFKEATKITNVYFEVGDHVNEGDVVVTYSTESIEKSISETQEDLATTKQQQALTAEQNESDYLYKYSSASTSLENKTEATEQALKDLYEACDAYGDAKRELEKYDSEHNNPDSEYYLKDRSTYESKVSSAYQTEQKAQKTYSDAVAAEATANIDSSYNLSKADNSKASAELTIGDSAKKLERQLETYEDNLEDYIVTAPISGIVTKVEVEEGNGFTSGNVMTIQEDDVLDITTEIDEYDIPNVAEGQKVIIKTDATGDDELEGVVTEVAPTATTSSSGASAGSSSSAVTYTVKIEIITKDDRLKLGMSAKINIITNEADDALVVRYDAIEEDTDGSHYINVVDNGSKSSQGAAPAGNAGDSQNVNGIAVVGVDGQSPDSGKAPDKSSKNSSSSTPSAPSTRKITVELGIVGDYETQIISDEISEGMQVVVSSEESGNTGDMEFGMMMGGGGAPGGGGGAPGGGGGGPR